MAGGSMTLSAGGSSASGSYATNISEGTFGGGVMSVPFATPQTDNGDPLIGPRPTTLNSGDQLAPVGDGLIILSLMSLMYAFVMIRRRKK